MVRFFEGYVTRKNYFEELLKNFPLISMERGAFEALFFSTPNMLHAVCRSFFTSPPAHRPRVKAFIDLHENRFS